MIVVLGIPWRTSGYDSRFPLQGAQVRSIPGQATKILQALWQGKNKKQTTPPLPPNPEICKDWNTGRAQGGCRFHIRPLTESVMPQEAGFHSIAQPVVGSPHPRTPIPECPSHSPPPVQLLEELPDGHGSHNGDGVGQAAMLPAQRQHLGVAWRHRERGHGPAQLGDGAAQPGPLQLLHPGGWRVSSESGQSREWGRSWAPRFPQVPPLPFCFWGSLQGTQCNQQLLSSDEGLHGGGCWKGEVDDLGHREPWRETCERSGGLEEGARAGLGRGWGSHCLPSKHHSCSEHGTWGPGHTQSPCARGTPKALFVHSFTSSLTQEHVLSTSCAPGAVPGDRG